MTASKISKAAQRTMGVIMRLVFLLSVSQCQLKNSCLLSPTMFFVISCAPCLLSRAIPPSLYLFRTFSATLSPSSSTFLQSQTHPLFPRSLLCVSHRFIVWIVLYVLSSCATFFFFSTSSPTYDTLLTIWPRWCKEDTGLQLPFYPLLIYNSSQHPLVFTA